MCPEIHPHQMEMRSFVSGSEDVDRFECCASMDRLLPRFTSFIIAEHSALVSIVVPHGTTNRKAPPHGVVCNNPPFCGAGLMGPASLGAQLHSDAQENSSTNSVCDSTRSGCMDLHWGVPTDEHGVAGTSCTARTSLSMTLCRLVGGQGCAALTRCMSGSGGGVASRPVASAADDDGAEHAVPTQDTSCKPFPVCV